MSLTTLERGFNNPGRAGLTVDRLGDAEEWKPRSAPLAKGDEATSDDESSVHAPATSARQGALGWR